MEQFCRVIYYLFNAFLRSFPRLKMLMKEEDSNKLINPRNEWKAAVDPGFPKNGQGVPTPYYFAIFLPKTA